MTITRNQIQVSVDDILQVIDRTVNSTKDAIENNIGRCRPLYTAAQNVADAVCISTLDPFNTIWFGLGWSLFFYIPCIIFAALLSNLYQRTNKYKARDKADDHGFPGYAGYGGRGNEDTLPLASSAGADRRDRSNGNYNHGYESQDRVSESRYYRDGNDRDSRYHDSRYDGYGGRPAYDIPMSKYHSRSPPNDHPPMYEEAVSSPYHHGGYPKDNSY